MLTVYARCRRAFAIRVGAFYSGLVMLSGAGRTIAARSLGCRLDTFSARECRWSSAGDGGVLARRNVPIDGGGESRGGGSSSDSGRHAVFEQPRRLAEASRVCSRSCALRCGGSTICGPCSCGSSQYRAGPAQQRKTGRHEPVLVCVVTIARQNRSSTTDVERCECSARSTEHIIATSSET